MSLDEQKPDREKVLEQRHVLTAFLATLVGEFESAGPPTSAQAASRIRAVLAEMFPVADSAGA